MLKYSEYAYEVYKERSFTKAAENLFISQPSLSLTVKKLEDELGAKIFDRSCKEIALTDIGKKYIRAVEEIKNIEKNLKNEIEDLQKLRRGKVTIGSTVFVSSCISLCCMALRCVSSHCWRITAAATLSTLCLRSARCILPSMSALVAVTVVSRSS